MYDKATLGFVVANAAQGSEKETMVFLSSDGVWCAIEEEMSKVDEGTPFAPLKDLVDKYPCALDYLFGALPGPYLLTRSMWVSALTRKAYRSHKKMADDIVKILREELTDLRDAGCDFVQFDEPVLTELTMSEECERRTFM